MIIDARHRDWAREKIAAAKKRWAKILVAVHLRLKSGVSGCGKITEYLEFEGIDEHSYREICCAYPVLYEALGNADATQEEIAVAVEQEKERLEGGTARTDRRPVGAVIQM